MQTKYCFYANYIKKTLLQIMKLMGDLLMFRMMNLISRKSKLGYVVIYIILKMLYTITPLISMWFLDNIVEGNIQKAIVFAILAVVTLVCSQSFDYLFDVKEGALTCESWNAICDKIRHKLEHYDLSENTLTNAQLQQLLGQEYEEIKDFIFKNPIRIIMSIIEFTAVELILFHISKLLFVVSLILIPCSLLISTRSNRKVEEISGETIGHIKEMKQYLEDSLILTREERTLQNRQLHSYKVLKETYTKAFLGKSKKVSFVNNIISYGSLNLIILITTLISGIQVYQQMITFGELYAIQLYIAQLWGPCEFLIEVKNTLYEIRPMLQDFLDFFHLSEKKRNNALIHSIYLDEYVSLGQDGNALHAPVTAEFLPSNIYILQGDNGSGKTTLLEALLGYTGRYQGNILVNGIKEKGQAGDMVYIPANIYISKFYDEKLASLSSGQKKKAQIALALQTDKSVYLIDEPTNFLDKEAKKEVLDILYQNTKEKLVILVTHDRDVINYFRERHIAYQEILLSK